MPESDPQHISDAMLEQILRAGIPESEMEELQHHLENCPYCRARLREQQQAESADSAGH